MFPKGMSKMFHTKIVNETVKSSLAAQSFQKKKRTIPVQDAQFWCNAGLDKDGFEKQFINTEIGSGVFATTEFRQGDFLLEYVGARITTKEAEIRNKTYARRSRKSVPRCYMYYFHYKNETYCIDATTETQRLAKYVNDASPKDPKCNAKMKLMVFEGYPRLCLFAIREIKNGDEIRYDYGEDKKFLFWRNKEVLSEKNCRPDCKKNTETSQPEDSDDDPFDVERDRRNQRSEDIISSDDGDRDLCDMVDVSDVDDPEYLPEKSDESSSSDVDVCDTEDNQKIDHVTVPSSSTDSQNLSKESSIRDEQTITTPSCKNTKVRARADDLEELWRQDNAEDDTPVGKIGPVTLRKSSFYFLKNTLSDEIMDAYMTMLVRGKNVLYIDAVEATDIFRGDLNRTSLLRNKDMEQYETVLAVVNENADHWILLIIRVKEQTILYLNPLGETASSLRDYCHRWYNFLDKRSEEGIEQTSVRPWRISTIPHQKQSDSISCGIFVLKFAEHYLEEKPLVISNTIEETRRQVGAKLLSSCIFDANLFGREDNQKTEPKKPNPSSNDSRVLSKVVQSLNVPCDGVKACATSNEGDKGLKNFERIGKETSEATAVYVTESDNTSVQENLNPLSSGSRTSSEDLTCKTCFRVFKKKGALTTHSLSHTKRTDEPYKKPKRPCPFCKVEQSQLKRHLKKKHSDESLVQEALSHPKGSKEKDEAFARIRKDGIYIYNKAQSLLPEPAYMSERKGHVDVKCSKCQGFFGGRLFYRHKELCTGDGVDVPTRIKISSLAATARNSDGEFERDILSRFHDDDIGQLCRSSPELIFIGRSLFQEQKGKVGKAMEVKKSVMSDLRILARLYLAFKEYVPSSQSLEDMFIVKNFDFLENAIEAVSRDENKLKYGLKNTLKYLIHMALEKMIGFHAKKEDDTKVSSHKRFLDVFKLHEGRIFADATYAINYSRQEKLRMPQQQADEEDIASLGLYIQSTIQELSSEFTFVDRHEFVLLRDSLCSRLTLFNARRGGEPSRLKMSQYHFAKDGKWINDKSIEQLSTCEKKLFSDMLVGYQPGKGNHLVPVLIPRDCIRGLDILCDPEIRKRVDVLQSNEFLFPNTSLSPDHVIGWPCIHKMCLNANIERPEKLTASKQRHRISTIYSALQVPESERQYFYKHMGHSMDVNLGTYQYPLPVMEVIKVGKHLQDIDRGTIPATATGPTVYCNVQETDEETLQYETVAERRRRVTSTATSSATNTNAFDHDLSDIRNAETFKETAVLNRNPQNDDQSSDGHVESVNIKRKQKKRSYFQWNDAETAAVKEDFKKWIYISEGNSLPSKRDLEEYIKRNGCRFNYKQLRTKIMNEQYAIQNRAKKRMSKMEEKC